MTTDLDPRIHPYRADLAAASLRGSINAPRFVEPVIKEFTQDLTCVKATPDENAVQVTEALFGETFSVYEEKEGWAWGQIETDNYIGYVPSRALGLPTAAKTHKIGVLRSYIFSQADLKSPPLGLVSLGARLALSGKDNGFAQVQGGGYVWESHIVEVSHAASDFVSVAEQFLGTPYLWGGRSSLGLDCSALVQLSLAAAGGDNGKPPPRDSDMQRSLGTYIPWHERKNETLQRGDLVFWKGHVGIMTSEDQMLHANAHHMAVAEEPLSQAIERIAQTGSEVLGIQRP